jgi:metallo-beta-lactamase class B
MVSKIKNKKVPTTSKITLTHVRGSVYVAENSHYDKENSVVYVGKNYVTIIGASWTPDTAKELAFQLKKISKKPIRQVINTHYHMDRVGGNPYWQSITAHIFSTQMTYDLISRHWNDGVKQAVKLFPKYPSSILLTLPDVITSGDFKLQNGKIQTLYLGPSHTEDHIFVYFPEEKILFGDCILKEKLGNIKDAHLSEYSNTLKKLKALNLDFTTIISGHWKPIHGPELIDHCLKLLEEKNKKS